MSSISTGTTTTTGYVVASDTTGSLVLKTGASATTAVTIDTSQNATFAKTANLPNTFGFKNRVINGAMVIDQRNAGASITPTSNPTYTVDRWAVELSVASKFSVQQNAGAITPPSGFKNYLGFTSLSAYSVSATDYFFANQKIEGFNFADMAWGTASAKAITLSAVVYSSLTGTFGGVLYNASGARSYPFTYTISSANTWTNISVTIAGDTTGTWATDNSTAVNVIFSLGAGATASGTAGAWSGSLYRSATGAVSVVGTNGATFYITGVQLEVGTVATSFDYRSYGTELGLCQRYCEVLTGTNNTRFALSGQGEGTSIFPAYYTKQTMRSAPSVTPSAASDFKVVLFNNTAFTATAVQADNMQAYGGALFVNTASTLAPNGGFLCGANSNAKITFSAEL
jgi:hypothetical protein